jgi:hypothetical protein
VLVPKEWGEDQQDESETQKLLASVDERLVGFAERDGFLEDFEKYLNTFTTPPTLEEVTARILEINHLLVRLNHQIRDAQNTLEQLEAVRQYVIEESSSKG